MIRLSKLKKGDTIGIVAPASSFDKDNFKQGMKTLRSLGYKVKYEKNIFNACWSKPGHNKNRANQINRMFADPQVKAILCAKAGYGSQEILTHLDPDIIKNNPKIFVGYSDITILLLYLQYVADMIVFHGPVVSGEFFRGMNPDTMDSFMRLLGDDQAYGRINYEKIKVFKNGEASGLLAGGNLTLVLESIGSEYEIVTDNRILFIEEVDESMDDIMEGLGRLKERGKLKDIQGIIFGRMTKCFERESEFLKFLNEFFENAHYPIVYHFPSGHTSDIAQAHFTLPLGVKMKIDTSKPSIFICEGAVQ